jgi:cell division protein FtsQ
MGIFVHEEKNSEGMPPDFPGNGSSKKSGIPEENLPEGRSRRIFSSRPFMAVVLLIIVLGLSGLAMYASRWKKGVVVGKVVVSGTSLLSRQDIEKRLHDFIGRNLEQVDTGSIRKRLLEQPYIRDIRVSKELNGIIRVEISERRPEAVTVYQDRKMIIDADGMLLPENGVSSRFARLPKVYGINGAVSAGAGTYRLAAREHSVLDRLLEALEASDYAGLMVRDIYLSGNNLTWFQAAGSPIRFIIGNEGNFKEKFKKFEIFWQKVIAKKGFNCYESVDLRFQDRVFAKEFEATGVQQDTAR